MPTGKLDEYWETPQTLNETWGYSKFDQRWKSPETVIRRLVDIASKGGNYLLNIGPEGDGTVPQPTLEVLARVGAWMKTNSESIYGTFSGQYAAPPWGRYTAKQGRLYLHVFEWPTDGVLPVSGLITAPKSAHLVGAAGGSLRFEKRGREWVVKVPAKAPDAVDTVIALEFDGNPKLEAPLVVPDAKSALRLDYMLGVTEGGAAKRFNRKGGYHISKWAAKSDAVSWRARVDRAGTYAVRITYAAPAGWAGGGFEVSSGAQVLPGKVQPTGDEFEYKSFELGQLKFARPGEYSLTIRPSAALSHYLMTFQALDLSPLGSSR